MDPEADEAPTRPYSAVAAIVGITAFVILALVMRHSTKAAGWERPIISAFERRPLPLRDFFVSIFEPIPFFLMATALAGVTAARGRIRLALAGYAGVMGAVVVVELILKPFVDRSRLRVSHHHLVRFGAPIFPSAHVTAAVALATFAWFALGRDRRLAPLLVALPLALGHSVISKKMHYPADVVGGFLIGWTTVYFVIGVTRAAVSGGEAAANSPANERPQGGYPALQRESE